MKWRDAPYIILPAIMFAIFLIGVFTTTNHLHGYDFSNKGKCERAAVESIGLQACWADQQCNLGRYEIYRLYASNKNLKTYCARANMEKTLLEALTDRDVQTPEPEEEALDKDELRANIR